MSHEVETMAYTASEGKPWHGLGEPVEDGLTPDEMATRARINWTILRQQLHTKVGDTELEVPDHYALVRDTDGHVLDVVGKDYIPAQPLQVVGFFKKFVDRGSMTMDTMGSLRNGKYIWALAKLRKGFTLVGGDEVEGNLLISNPNVYGESLIAQFTPVRVVCMNTLTFALGSKLNGKGTRVFRMPHVYDFSDEVVQESAELALGLADSQFTEYKALCQMMAKATMNDDDAVAYFKRAFRVRAKEAEAFQLEVDQAEDKLPRTVTQCMRYREESPGADLESARGTVWGALNAVTYRMDHSFTEDNRDRTFTSAVLGNRARIKRRAFDLATIVAADQTGTSLPHLKQLKETYKVT